MTPKDRFIAALEKKPLMGRVPHFELVYFLTMEAFGKCIPCTAVTRNGSRWRGRSVKSTVRTWQNLPIELVALFAIGYLIMRGLFCGVYNDISAKGYR